MPNPEELVEALTTNLDDISGLADKYLEFIIAKDALIAEKDQKILDLVAAANISAAEKTALTAKIQTAFDASETTENKLRAGLPGVPPVGGTPLNQSYPTVAEFNTAAAAYTGPEGVTLDGNSVKSGTPLLDYFTRADGSVDTVGPTGG
jgi:hypothetical protein